MTDLTRLEEEEQSISQRRRELLVDMDQLRLNAPRDEARLGAIEEEERALSSRRRTLQHQIDGLRLRLRLPQGPRDD
jgi:hypothetical protein